MIMDHDDNQTINPGVDELNATLPRKVRLSDDARNLFGVAVSFIIVGAISLAVIYHIDAKQMRQREALRGEGRDAAGDVTAKGSSRGGVWVDYTFKVDGLAYKGTALLPRRHIDANVGGQIPIRYLPSDPSVSHPSEWEWSGVGHRPPFFYALFPRYGCRGVSDDLSRTRVGA